MLPEQGGEKQAMSVSDTLHGPEAPADTRQLLQGGIARVQQGDAAGALADFRQAVRLWPDCAEAWNNCGLVLHLLQRSQEAVADFDRALSIRPDYPEALLNLAGRQALGDLAGARADFDQALSCADSGLRFSVLQKRGLLRQAQGDLAGALEDLDAALHINPGDPGTLLKRGEVRQEAGDLSGALADCDRALELAPPEQRAFAYHCRGGVRVLLRDFPGAGADYDQALALEPENVCFYISRGHARYHRRDMRSLVDYRMAFRLDRDAAAREIVRLVRDLARRDAAEVLENCRQHLRIEERDAVAHLRLGLTLLFLQQEAEAETHFTRGRELLPNLVAEIEHLIAAAREPAPDTSSRRRYLHPICHIYQLSRQKQRPSSRCPRHSVECGMQGGKCRDKRRIMGG
jgi:tetratricopeptide (TPR) repeat protein